MAGFNFGGFEEALAETRGNGVSFESQAKKWETENEGLIKIKYLELICLYFKNNFIVNLQQKISSMR